MERNVSHDSDNNTEGEHITYSLLGTHRNHQFMVMAIFIVFVGGLKKKQWIQENNRCRSHS
jgi:hypothetical protein